VGIHRDPQTLVDTLRAMRRQVDISTEVGVVHDIRLQVGSSNRSGSQQQQPVAAPSASSQQLPQLLDW
jgi:hypothetical protein